MSYEKTVWVDGSTALSAEHMNKIENELETLEGEIGDLDAAKVDKETGKSLTSNDFTNAYKTKLDGIATGAEVNQNAFGYVKVGSTTIAADSKTDTLTLTAGSNVTLTAYASDDTVTIAATNTDTHYTTHLYAGTSSGSSNAATTNGNTYLMVLDNSTVRDRRKIAGSGATSVSSDSSGNITISSTNTTYSAATTSAAGLMSAADKSKLNGIASNANHITTADFSTTGSAIASGSYATISINLASTVTGAGLIAAGNSPIGIVGISLTGTNNSYLSIYRFYVSGNTCYVVVRNTSSSSVTPAVTFYVLWYK